MEPFRVPCKLVMGALFQQLLLPATFGERIRHAQRRCVAQVAVLLNPPPALSR